MGFLRFGKFAFLQQIVNSAAYGCFIAIQRGSNLFLRVTRHPVCLAF
jgi:hypothetical protein